MIYRELSKAMETGVVVALYNDPGGSVADAEIDDLASHYKLMQTIHKFRDGSSEVPPMKIEQIDVVSLQLFETGFDRYPQALGVVATRYQ